MKTLLDAFSNSAHWLMRLALAAVFLYHGAMISVNFEASAVKMNLPLWVTVLVGLAQIGGGLFIIIGGFWKDWMTRLGAAMLIPVMVGAIILVHGKFGFDIRQNGMEYNIVLLSMQLYFLFRGNRA